MGVCLSRCGTHNWESRHSVEAKKRKTSAYAPSPYDPNHSFKMFLQAQSKNSPSTTWSLPRSSELFSLPASELHEHRPSPSDATSSCSRAASISSSSKKKRIQPEQPGHQRLLEAIARLERLDDKKPGGNCALGMSSLCSSDDVDIAMKPRRNRRVRHYQLPLPKENPVQDFLRSIEGFVSLIDEPRKPPEPNINVSRREPNIVSRVDDGAFGEETFAFEFGRLRQDQNQVPMSTVQRLPQSSGPQNLKITGASVTDDCKSPRNRCGSINRELDGAVVGEETLFALEFEALAGLRQDRNQELQVLQGLPQSGPRKIDMKCPDVAGTVRDCEPGPSSITVACVEPSEDAGVGEETFTLDFKALKHQKLQAPPPSRKSMSLQQLLQSTQAQNNHLKSPRAQDRIKPGPSCRAPEAHVKIGQDDIVASLRSRNVVARKNYKSTRSLTRGRGGLKQEKSSRSLESLQSFDIHVNWEFDNNGEDFATPIPPSSITPPTNKHLDEEALPSIEVKKMESELLQVSPTWSSNTSTAVVENQSPKDVEAPLVEDALECTELGPPAPIVSSKSSDSKQIVQFISERFGLLEAFQSLLKILLFNTEEDPDEENQYGVHPRE